MKKRLKLLASLSTFCLAIAVLCFGVFAAIKVTYSVSGTISYEVNDAYVNITSRLYRYANPSLLDGGEAYEKMLVMRNTSTTDITNWPSDVTLVEELGTYSSLTGEGSTEVTGIDLKYGKYAEDNNMSYAYFIVITVENLSADKSVYTAITDVVNPPESWQLNSSGHTEIFQTDGTTKNVVFAFGLNYLTTSVGDSDISYTIEVGPFEGTKGLVYELNDDEDGYIVTDLVVEELEANTVVIPNTYNELPVVAIDASNSTNLYDGMEGMYTVVIGDNVESINHLADNACVLRSVVFSDNSSITEVTDSFADNDIYSIIIPNSLTTLPDMFANNEISVLYIPANIEEIPSEYTLSNISESNPNGDFIRVAEDNQVYTSIVNGEQINGIVTKNIEEEIPTEDIVYLRASDHATVIPDKVTVIEEYSFGACRNLKAIQIPSSVTSIGEWAFSDCDNLEKFILNGEEQIKFLDNFAYNALDTDIILAFSDDTVNVCDSVLEGFDYITTVEIPSSVETIGERAFANTSITELTIPSSVTEIGAECLAGCRYLTDLTLPFVGRLNYTSQEDVLEKEDGYYMNATIYHLFDNVEFDGGVVCSADVVGDIYYDYVGVYVPEDLSVINILTGCNIIAKYAFLEDINEGMPFTNITLPNTIKEIGDNSFYGCLSLENITIEEGERYTSKDKSGEESYCIIEKSTNTLIQGCANTIIPTDRSVTKIGVNAFCCNNVLTAIEIPSNVVSIEIQAFYHCDNLVSITFMQTPEEEMTLTIGNSAFHYIKEGAKAYIQSGYTWTSDKGDTITTTEITPNTLNDKTWTITKNS